MTIALQLRDEEADAVLNALNYFAHAIDADECSTLLGMEQAGVRELYERLREARGGK